jgi:hypothetical protein
MQPKWRTHYLLFGLAAHDGMMHLTALITRPASTDSADKHFDKGKASLQ